MGGDLASVDLRLLNIASIPCRVSSMLNLSSPKERDTQIAKVLRPLGNAPLSREQATRAAQLLGVHWTTVYRLRARFLKNPVTSSVSQRKRGPRLGSRRIGHSAEQVIESTLVTWLPRQREIAHLQKDVHTEVQLRCHVLGIDPPTRYTVRRRLIEHQEAQLTLLSDYPDALIAPGEFGAAHPLDIVQMDTHKRMCLLLTDGRARQLADLGYLWRSISLPAA